MALYHGGAWEYYLEAAKPRQLQLAAATAQPPIQPLPISLSEALALPEQLPQAVATHSTDRPGVRESRTPTATRRQSAVALSNLRKAEGNDEPWGSGQCPLYGTDQSLAAGDKTHIKLGCWAVDTANANLRVSMADYIGIQETKVPEGQPCAEAADAAKATKWKLSIGGCLALN